MHDGTIELAFGGDARAFRLGNAELLAIEDATPRSIFEIAERFGQPLRVHYRDVREILRIGLIGGGMEPAKAKQLVDEALPGNAYGGALTARLVLSAGLMPLEDDPPGKAADAADAPEATSVSPPASSSETAQSSDSPRKKPSK
jgi:hypothetical protein